MKNKFIKFLISLSIIIFVIILAYNNLYNNKNVHPRGNIIYSLYNNLYTSSIMHEGKKTILSLPRNTYINVLDRNIKNGSLLIDVYYNDEKKDALLLFSNKKLTKLYLNDKNKNLYINFAKFNNKSNEVFFIEDSMLDNSTVLKKVNLITGTTYVVTKSEPIEKIIFSSDGNNCLISEYNPKNERNFKDIYLYNPSTNKKIKLTVGSSPIWFKDGETFLYYGIDNNIYEFNIISKKSKLIVRQYFSFNSMILSPDKNYLIQKQYSLEGLGPSTIITSIKNGKSIGLDLYELYGISSVDLENIIWIK